MSETTATVVATPASDEATLKWNDRNNSSSSGDCSNSDETMLKYNNRNNSDSAGDRSNSDDMTMVYNDRNNSGSDCSNNDDKTLHAMIKKKQ